MTNEKKERINELETALSPILANFNGFDERYNAVKAAVTGFSTGEYERVLESDIYKDFLEYKTMIYELGKLYDELVYNPKEDEELLSYLFSDGMSVEKKLKALSDAWWYATNSGYCNAMANRLMAGEEDRQTELWEKNCENKWEIDRYYNYLSEENKND